MTPPCTIVATIATVVTPLATATLVTNRIAEQASDLSETAQLASEMWCCAKKFIQACVSPRSRLPSPGASQVPHSVANTATPLAKAADTLFLNDCLWVLA